MTLEELGDRFEGTRRAGSNLRARCPAHGSRGLTLSLKEGEDGSLLVHCFAGCETAAVLAAVGLTYSDLFAEGRKKTDHWQQSPFPHDPQAERMAAELTEQARSYGIPVEELVKSRFSRFAWLPSDLDLLRARVMARVRGTPWTAAKLEEAALANDWDWDRIIYEAECLTYELAARVRGNVMAERVGNALAPLLTKGVEP